MKLLHKPFTKGTKNEKSLTFLQYCKDNRPGNKKKYHLSVELYSKRPEIPREEILVQIFKIGIKSPCFTRVYTDLPAGFQSWESFLSAWETCRPFIENEPLQDEDPFIPDENQGSPGFGRILITKKYRENNPDMTCVLLFEFPESLFERETEVIRTLQEYHSPQLCVTYLDRMYQTPDSPIQSFIEGSEHPTCWTIKHKEIEEMFRTIRTDVDDYQTWRRAEAKIL